MIRRWTVGAITAAFILFVGTPARACGPQIEIRFFESQGDIFVIANKSERPWVLLSLVIHLKGSRGYLIFDTEDGGPGFSMHEPFAAVDDEVGFLGIDPVEDGAEEITLHFSDFRPGREFMFMIDVDDRLESSDYGRAVVSGAEIEGARAWAVLSMPGGGKTKAKTKAKGVFGSDSRALLRGALCA